MSSHLHTANVRHTFTGAPSKIILNLQTLSNGTYITEGQLDAATWQTICNRLGHIAGGCAAAKLVIDKTTGGISIKGFIRFSLQRQCSRTLQTFIHTQQIDVSDVFSSNNLPELEHLDGKEHEPQSFVLADYIAEQILLGLDPYPLHPSTLSTPRGTFGQPDTLPVAKKADTYRPFAALKKLSA